MGRTDKASTMYSTILLAWELEVGMDRMQGSSRAPQLRIAAEQAAEGQGDEVLINSITWSEEWSCGTSQSLG
jgi:hypothetical protein